jgi:hypothetical protein
MTAKKVAKATFFYWLAMQPFAVDVVHMSAPGVNAMLGQQR